MAPPPDVLTLDDLDDPCRWSFAGTPLAVLGWPIHHSISPAMHHAALGRLAESDARFSSWGYFRFAVPPDALPAALGRLHAAGFHGLNLTVPHKVIAFDHVEAVDPAARPIGAVNTLRRTATGWQGFNTDGYGLATAVRETLGHPLAGADVILLGAGGAARGAAVECVQQGARSLWIGNRSQNNLSALMDVLCGREPRLPLTDGLAPHYDAEDFTEPKLDRVAGNTPVRRFDPSHPPADLPARALVINATSAGLRPEDAPPLDLARLPHPPAAVYDMIYNPPETRLLAQARALGLPAANGLSMLVHQGARALEIWTGRTAPAGVMHAAAAGALAAKA